MRFKSGNSLLNIIIGRAGRMKIKWRSRILVPPSQVESGGLEGATAPEGSRKSLQKLLDALLAPELGTGREHGI